MIGTFIVKHPNQKMDHLKYRKGWQIVFCRSMDSVSGKIGSLDQSVSHNELCITSNQYDDILIMLGGKLITVCEINHVGYSTDNRSGLKEDRVFTIKEIFFPTEAKAIIAADWANSRLTELKLTGNEFKRGIYDIFSKHINSPTLYPPIILPSLGGTNGKDDIT